MPSAADLSDVPTCCGFCGKALTRHKRLKWRQRKMAQARLGKEATGPFCNKVCSDRSRRNHPDYTTKEKKKFAVRST